jgi:hypothetical protein
MIKDVIKYEVICRFKDQGYLEIHNRTERISQGPNGKGYVCLWPYTSRLHAPQVWPYLGRKLLRLVVDRSGFFNGQVRSNTKEEIDISVLIGHRGMDRLPHLLCTISYIAAQEGVSLECIVVEQDTTAQIERYLPSWIKYRFIRTDEIDSYNRSAAFNAASRYASGKVLLLHDNDMLIPKTYCKDILELVKKGYEAINSKRFVFYLNQFDSVKLMDSVIHIGNCNPEYIVQNLEAGGSMAITKEGYQKIGGMDESFIGWGGEDNEFWRRCSILNRWIWGYASVIHLWHPSQPMKGKDDNVNITRARELISINLRDRINDLAGINRFDTNSGEN